MSFGLFDTRKITLLPVILWHLVSLYGKCGINSYIGLKELNFISFIELGSIISENINNEYLLFTNEQVLSVMSNYPTQTRSKKFKFEGSLIDPVSGTAENRLSYLELLNFSKENESSLVSQVPKGKELAQLMPVELFCTHLSQLIKCLVREFAPNSRSDNRLYFVSPSNLTWLVYKGSHGKVVVGYLTSPSSEIRYDNENIDDDEYHSNVSSERYTPSERDFLHVNSKDVLRIDTSSEFYKRFKPKHSGNMSNIRIYFHGNSVYFPGWLEEGTTAQVVVKGEVRLNSNRNDMFWTKEREYTFFLSSSEIWRSRDHSYLNFIPGIFSIYHITNSENGNINNKNLKGKYASNMDINNLSSKHLIEDIKNKDGNLSEFMIMEYTKGMRFFELIRRLKSVSAVYFYNSTKDWQGWFRNALYLFYLSLYIVATFSTTGRYLYLHCDFHGNNIIVHNVPSNTLSRILFTNMQKIVKIEKIKLIDLMFIWTPKEVGDRNKSNPCTENHEVAISDIECLNSLVLGRLFLWDNFPFDSTPEKTNSYLEIYRKSKDFFDFIYNIPEWRRISSYFVGGGPEWFQQWKSIGKSNKKASINTFNEQFEGVMVVCDYLNKFMSLNGIYQEPCFSFESYLRGYNLLSYRIMRIGSCIKKNIGFFFNNLYNFKNERVLSKVEVSYWELSRLTLILYWNILATNMRTCLPPSKTKYRDDNYLEDSSYKFEFSSKLKGVDVRLITLLERNHCDIIFTCLNDEDNSFKDKYEKLYKVNKEINGFKFTGIYGTSSLRTTFSTFINDIKKNSNYNNSLSRSLKNLRLDTILTLNGKSGSAVSDKSPTLIQTQKAFEYEEFLLDRWIYNLYHQYSFSPSFVLAGIRYSFRLEPTLSGKSGKIIGILEQIKRAALMNGFIGYVDENPSSSTFDNEKDISEAELVHSCNMFYLTYYEIAIEYYIKEDENCFKVLENIGSNANYAKFKKHHGYQKYNKGIRDIFFTENGDQELMIIDKGNICSYNYIDINSNNTPNSEFIFQGFCEILLKPLNNIKMLL
ncbi:hypothetical protein RS030_192915 [Cryptosporidium xiaoi]|uniref:Protein kinase domain-containing protein n=1 Tax=Cryptosporidium xiaoi TaxID=659607 RepID=A0AAV9Y091_9CRYT